MSRQNPDAQANGDGGQDFIDLEPTLLLAQGPAGESHHVQLVTGDAPSLGASTTSLLHHRLRYLTIALLMIHGMVAIFVLLNDGEDFPVFRIAAAIRLTVLGALLAFLYARPRYPMSVLMAVEYGTFALMTIVWIWTQFQTDRVDARSGDVLELVMSQREGSVSLMVLILAYGIFIPHPWHVTARVVLTIALAPLVAQVLLQELHPELRGVLDQALTLRNISANILIVLVGAVLAIYSAGVLNTMRHEVHEARRFGQYQLVRKIGGGGMGEVFLAEHELMKRPCAMKLIRHDSAQDPTNLARFEREVRVTSQLTHPNTIAIFDYGHTTDGTFYYVMEYLPGLSLAELVARHGPLSPGRAIFLLRQACSALAEAHLFGLIHRDLKPANIFISERGGLCDFVKVLDFGLVKLTADQPSTQLTADNMVSGTPLYMAPEQATGAKGIDARTDQYALGAIAYFMLTGRPPFEADSPVHVMIMHARDEVVPPSNLRPEVPVDLEAIVIRCLSKKAEDRFTDCLELEQALAKCEAAGDWDATQAATWWQRQTEAQPVAS